MSKRNLNSRKLVTLAVLSALGTILMLFEIPSPIFWLKFDISDVVVYLSAVIYGPVGAVVVAFVKSLIHYLFNGGLAGVPINQFIAFIASLSYALPLYYLTKMMHKAKNTKFKRVLPLVFSSICMVLFMTIVNYWLTDFYIRLLLSQDIMKVGTISHVDVMTMVQGPLRFSLPTWVENSRFLPKDIWLWFIILTYTQFNLLKTLITSIVFFILSYRLAEFIERFKVTRVEDSVLLQVKHK